MRTIGCLTASALLLIFSFPTFDAWFFAWCGLVPLLFAIDRQTWLRVFFIAYGTGLLFFSGTIYWLAHVTLPGTIILIMYLALFIGCFGIAARYMLYAPRYAVITIPAAWVALEYLRVHLFSGFGWALLGFSQYKNLPIIQIADLTGAYGVSFLVVMVNVGIYLMLQQMKFIQAISKVPQLCYRRNVSAPLIFLSLLLFVTLSYGMHRLNSVFTGESLRISVIQGNIPQKEKWESAFSERIIRTYERLTRKAVAEHPDLIIWPETAVPGYVDKESALKKRITALAQEVATPLLVGAPRKEEGRFFNSALFISKSGRITAQYDKLNLVPFGEYIPFKRLFSFVERFAPLPIGNFTRGSEHTVFGFEIRRYRKTAASIIHKKKNVKFSSLICFEDIFPGLARTFINKGAQFLVNITNDAWFMKSAAPYQHTQASVLRAVETRSNIVRAANTGISCFIDQKGRITGKVTAGEDDIFIDGVKTQDIFLTATRSFYVRYGDLFAFLAIAVTILSLAAVRIRRERL